MASGTPALTALRARVAGLPGRVSGLAALSEKYELLCELRSGEAGRTLERRDAMRKIAARFPAALREWDEASLAELAARRAEVDRLLAEVAELDATAAEQALTTRAPGWLRYGLELHPRLALLLAAKRWLSGQRDAADREARFRERFPGLSMQEIVTPPGGRLTELAFREVARVSGVGIDEVKTALFEFAHEPGEADAPGED